MFMPGSIAPNKCEHICSGETILFQHCGMSTCLDNENNYGCLEIPEFILHSHQVEKILIFEPTRPTNFRPALHGTFDSQTLQFQMKNIKKFVSIKRLLNFCRVYSKICKANHKQDGVILLIDH